MGIAPGSVERLLRALQRKNEWEAYGVAIATISAGIWPRERLFLAGLVESDLCQRCGNGTDEDVVEDLLHRYWDCPANEHIDHPDVQDTQYMMHGTDGALKTGEEWPLFWCRGLCPRGIYPLPPAHEESFTLLEKTFRKRYDCFGHLLRSYIFTDGSGGSTGSDRRRRRCGWSVVQVDVVREPLVVHVLAPPLLLRRRGGVGPPPARRRDERLDERREQTLGRRREDLRGGRESVQGLDAVEAERREARRLGQVDGPEEDLADGEDQLAEARVGRVGPARAGPEPRRVQEPPAQH